MNLPSTISPADYLCRSPLYRQHQALHAVFRAHHSVVLVDHYNSQEGQEVQQARELGLADLTSVTRLGFKGPDAAAWLQEHGLVIPEVPNRSLQTSSGVIVARLSATEFMLLDNPAGPDPLMAELRRHHASLKSMSQVPLCYLIERGHSHACLCITGTRAAAMFAKLCAVDLRVHHFSNGSVAQTSVASSNAIIIRSDLGATPAYYLLFDISLAEYHWGCVVDAMQEYGGVPVGMTAWNTLSES